MQSARLAMEGSSYMHHGSLLGYPGSCSWRHKVGGAQVGQQGALWQVGGHLVLRRIELLLLLPMLLWALLLLVLHALCPRPFALPA